MSYSNEFLSSVDWIKKSNKIKKRDLNTCCMCGCQHNQVEVHHIAYGDDIMFDDDNLVTVCPECHEIIHDTVKLYDRTNFLPRNYTKLQELLLSGAVRIYFESFLKHPIENRTRSFFETNGHKKSCEVLKKTVSSQHRQLVNWDNRRSDEDYIMDTSIQLLSTQRIQAKLRKHIFIDVMNAVPDYEICKHYGISTNTFKKLSTKPRSCIADG